MNRTKLNYWIDVGLAMSFFACFITGLIKWPGLVKMIGVPAYKALHVSGISLVHDWSGIIMGALIFVHLALQWKWIVAVTKKVFGKN